MPSKGKAQILHPMLSTNIVELSRPSSLNLKGTEKHKEFTCTIAQQIEGPDKAAIWKIESTTMLQK